jgi:hypothetical protein
MIFTTIEGVKIITEVDIRAKLGVQSPSVAVPYLNMLIYGEPGVGKTYLAATAQDCAETKPILFVDVEGGTLTIRRRSDVDVRQVRTIKDVETIHNILYEDAGSYYKTVILDSLTELQKLDMKAVMEKEYNTNPERIDKDVPTQRAWGKSGNRVRAIIQAYRDLPIHTICTCLLAQEHDDTNGITTYFPSLPGKLRGEVSGYFDIVGYLKVEQGGAGTEQVRKLQIAKTRRVIAKDRTGSLGEQIESPTIPLIMEMIANDPTVEQSKPARKAA